jgi:hypothetical protein
MIQTVTLITPFIVGIAFLLMACSPALPDEKERDMLAAARKKRKARMKKIDEMYGVELEQKD